MWEILSTMTCWTAYRVHSCCLKRLSPTLHENLASIYILFSFVWVCMRACVCASLYTQVKVRGWHLRSSSVTFCFIFFETGSLTEAGAHGLSKPAVCCFSLLGLQMCAAMSSLLHGCLGYFRFSARASTSPSELSSEPLCPSCTERMKQQWEREAAHLPPKATRCWPCSWLQSVLCWHWNGGRKRYTGKPLGNRFI